MGANAVSERISEEERELLKESAARLFERAGGLARSRRLRWRRPSLDRAIWKEMAEAGLLGLMLPEEAGGAGLGPRAAATVTEQLGRQVVPEPLVASTVLAGGLLAAQGTGAARALLVRLAGGEALPILAWQERGHDGLRPRHTVLERGVLRGAKSWVLCAEMADPLLVTALEGEEPVLCALSADAGGLIAEHRRSADGRFLSELRFDEVRVPEDAVLARGARVSAALARALDHATALSAVEMVGASAAAFEMTIAYLKTRKQFGRPIGSFQALQHRAVDLLVHLEVARATMEEVLREMERDPEPRRRALLASRAKARAGELGRRICRETIQMHGALGYTDEYDLGLFVNRLVTLSAWLGDDASHRRRWLALADPGEAAG